MPSKVNLESQITIENRYCGLSNRGNGGYTCGLLANFIEGTAEVTLIQPPPIDTPMTVRREKDRLVLYNKDVLIAEAKPTELDLTPPEPPTFAAASISAMKKEDFPDHYALNCFVCGPKRDVGDGLRIFPRPVKGKNYVAAVWVPDSSLSDSIGYIKNETIWAALDCTGGLAIIHEKRRAVILGRLTVQILNKIRPGEECIAMGWKISGAGKKMYLGTAIYSTGGQLYAKGKATWFDFKQT